MLHNPASPGSGPSDDPRRARRMAEWLLSLLAAALGVVYGFGFGKQVGGVFIGALAALCAGAMAAILVDSVFDLWARWTSRDR